MNRKNSVMPICPFEHEDCAARKNDTCSALEDTDFKGKDCAFYKNKAQNAMEIVACEKRLIQKGFLAVKKARRTQSGY